MLTQCHLESGSFIKFNECIYNYFDIETFSAQRD